MKVLRVTEMISWSEQGGKESRAQGAEDGKMEGWGQRLY